MLGINKKEVSQEIKEDLNWDYNSYQGRSRRQVANNENVAYYSTIAIVAASVVCILCYLIA